MKLIIDIPDNIYDAIKKVQAIINVQRSGKTLLQILVNSVENGTPLPKEHGRLIDADEYKEHLYACETNGRPLHIMELDERLATVDEVPTIIEADKESL